MDLATCSETRSAKSAGEPFLPDFGSMKTLLLVVLLAELLAVILSLAGAASAEGFWSDLGLWSLFIIWIALGSAAMLCALKGRLDGMPPVKAGFWVCAVVQAVTLALGWAIDGALPGAGLAFRDLPGHGVGFRHLRNLAISGLVTTVWLRYQYVQHQWRHQAKAEGLARLDALQARVRPHFLFNSLNTIASLTRRQPTMAEELLLDLAELFRAILKKDDRLTTLEEELHLVRQYLNIERQRLGERLRIIWNLEAAPKDALLPPLSVQPLVENAVYHGIEPSAQGGMLEIHGQRRKGDIVLTVRNPLPGGHGPTNRQGNQEALGNLRLRLRNCFADQGQLLTSVVDDRYQARIVIPYRSKTHAHPDRG
jgi:two-component system sensor histidine kinase AlgZ